MEPIDRARLKADLERLVPLVLVSFGVAMGGFGRANDMVLRGGAALVAGVAALLLVRLWGERLRPKPRPGWWIVGLALAAWVIVYIFGGLRLDVPTYLVLPTALFAGFFLGHDHRQSPTMLIAVPIALALCQPGLNWPEAGEDPVWWLGLAGVFAVFAAEWERERLVRKDDAPTPTPWLGFRLGFVALWTVIILGSREDIQWAAAFAWVGIDPGGLEGQVTLLSVLLAAILVAVLVLRPPGRRKEQPPNAKP